jgi:hypothetical protein
MVPIDSKCLSVSYGSFDFSAGFIVQVVLLLISSVWPSGAACATAWAPSTVPAPALFSTITVLPAICCCRWRATMRPSVSAAPPGG